MCKPWSPRLCPYPSLAQKKQTYLELKDPEVGHPHLSPHQSDKNRSKQANRRQFKVRVIEKPLFPTNEATTTTVTQSTRTDEIMTSVTWPTTKTTKVSLTIYNVPNARIQETPDSPRPQPRPKSSAKIQELPSSSMLKPKGKEGPLIPIHNNPLMEKQPASLEPKASATATSAFPPTRDATSWANSVLASTYLFVVRSWPITPNRNDIPAPVINKMKRPNAENSPIKQAVIPHPMVLGNSAPNNNNMILPSVPSEELCRWGPHCSVCTQSAPHQEPEDSNWEEEDWDGDIQKVKREEKAKEGR